MNLIDYYRHQFRHDLETVAAGFDSISVVSLKGGSPGGYHRDSAEAFKSLEKKRPFLFCYFFCVLLDQSVHTVSREEHRHFDAFWQCPKFQGILGTAHTNLHPALILDAAIQQVRKVEEEESRAGLNQLSEFFSSEYRRILTEEYPAQAGRIPGDGERQRMCDQVLAAAGEGLALLAVPGGHEGLAEDAPWRKKLYTTWVLNVGRF
ncbi:hypothetical protein N9X25_04425 [Verrucomicrobiales bacterium]|nr:hypothetical protein [Verrucomicrobiales bacterium]